MNIPLVIVLSLFFGSVGSAQRDDFRISKTSKALDLKGASSIGLNEYFQARDLVATGDFVLEDAMQFDEMALFHLESPVAKLDQPKRVELAKRIFGAMTASLRTFGQRCEIEIESDGRRLAIDDFRVEPRTELGQPGTRLRLTSNESGVASAWRLICDGADGGRYQARHGGYFFVVIDVIANEDPRALGNRENLFDYVFSFR